MRVFFFRNVDGEDQFYAKAMTAKAAAKVQAMDQEADVVVWAYESIKAPTSEILAQALNFGANDVEGLGNWIAGKKQKVATVTKRAPSVRKAAAAPAKAAKGGRKAAKAVTKAPKRKAA